MEGLKLKRPTRSIHSSISRQLKIPQIKLPSLQSTPIRNGSTQRYSLRSDRQFFAEDRDQ